nr:MAG TPA: hypothetical protein [Caudoviricetes sp.]
MNATNCVNYEILSESNAYFLGGKKRRERCIFKRMPCRN